MTILTSMLPQCKPRRVEGVKTIATKIIIRIITLTLSSTATLAIVEPLVMLVEVKIRPQIFSFLAQLHAWTINIRTYARTCCLHFYYDYSLHVWLVPDDLNQGCRKERKGCAWNIQNFQQPYISRKEERSYGLRAPAVIYFRAQDFCWREKNISLKKRRRWNFFAQPLTPTLGISQTSFCQIAFPFLHGPRTRLFLFFFFRFFQGLTLPGPLRRDWLTDWTTLARLCCLWARLE